MSGALRTLRLYGTLVAAAWRAELQYRANFVLLTLGGLAYQGAGLAFIWVVVAKFGAIGGWDLDEVAFLYGLRLAAHALWVVPFNQVNLTDLVVRQGEFDRFLVRPLNPLVQLMTRRVSLMSFGDLFGGVALLTVTSIAVDVDWSPGAVAYLMLAVVGGALVELSIQLAVSGLSFRLLSTRSLRIMLDNVFNTFGGYPLHIFPAAAQFGLTFVLPLAFVAYFPATMLLDHTEQLAVAPWLAWCAPLAGVGLFAAAYRFWRHQTRHYTSSGH